MTSQVPEMRKAEERDVEAIAAILAADDLGGHGDTTDAAALPEYLKAFRAIEASPNETLYVVERAGEVVATFQTLITTTMSGRGSSAMIIEAVFTRPDCRGQGIGSQMIRFCIEEAGRLGMGMVQLTSNAARKDAHRFYERLGFRQSHLGFKIKLK
ncbi:GNAT family N-acetyltransferase [Rhizobium sp. RU36D]|uniref:GNAT family N-acetyltransferase n=1 Tax=Rhizobium sp. RU36D TaxID=1907415 RepID=UPI0009D8914F|nr:GNAT family N-acetyltransferase [Rhizobium sp. RU36D]SMD05654.1 Predicted N-acetyltransferase YhbS [Rhizobium sp. RU36D]